MISCRQFYSVAQVSFERQIWIRIQALANYLLLLNLRETEMAMLMVGFKDSGRYFS